LTGGNVEKAYFEFERLDVYKAAVEFRGLSARLLPSRGHAELRDQIDRASISVVANIAEGAGKTAKADKRRFYETARGSASELGALLEMARKTKAASDATYDEGRGLLLRCLQMLTRLAGSPRE
jgi:four helix bundle protein